MAVLTYKCPNCGAQLIFRPESQHFVCDYCGSHFAQPELDKMAPVAGNHEENKSREQMEETVSYQCPSCGAQLMTTGTTAATYCYYCHNPVTVSGRLSGQWQPDAIIPFSVSAEQAKEKFMQWCKRNPFVDRRFFSESQIEKLSGVYFPFWLVSGKSKVAAEATARNIRIWVSGETEYTETSVYSLIREGEMSTRNYDIVALNREETTLLEGILTYDYSQIKPFSAAYLSGFQAERRNQERSDLEEQVRNKMREHATRLLQESFDGFTTISLHNCDIEEKSTDWKYLLLPAWILTYQYHGKKYFFAMNGQNGMVNGKLPISIWRMAKLFGLVSGISFILLTIGGYFL